MSCIGSVERTDASARPGMICSYISITEAIIITRDGLVNRAVQDIARWCIGSKLEDPVLWLYISR